MAQEESCGGNRWQCEVITDIRSGLNYSKCGLELLNSCIFSGGIDRLVGFATELVFTLRGYLSKDNHKGGYAFPCRSTSKDFNRGR